MRQGGLEAVPVSIRYAPLFSSEGALLNIIASVRDITRYRAAEEMKTSFISTISHELKTPIALIKGYASTLRRDDVQWEPEMIQESLQVIEDEADHLAAMVEDLLTATKLQSGDVVLKKSEFDLIALVQDQIRRFNPQLRDHKIVARFPANFPLIVADEGRVEQLISNLITNALKYTSSRDMHCWQALVVCAGLCLDRQSFDQGHPSSLIVFIVRTKIRNSPKALVWDFTWQKPW